MARRLVAYTSAAAHGCLPRAMEMAGLGRDALRMIPCDAQGRMRLDALARQVADDRADGARPFLVVGTAGTVDIGAIDDLDALADFAADQGLWFHVDGGVRGDRRPGAEAAAVAGRGSSAPNSVAFDFHKWAQVPVRRRLHHRPRRHPASSIRSAPKPPICGARNAVWPAAASGRATWAPICRGASGRLKVWMTLSVYGADRIGAIAQQTCDLAQTLAARVDREPALQRLAPVALNIVCFRYVAADGDLDRLNADIVGGSAGGGHRRAIHHHGQRGAGDPGGDRQSPDQPCRHRDPGGCGAGGRPQARG